MAVQLCEHVVKSCDLGAISTIFWTDSTIVLHWIRKDSGTLKLFVSHRVSNIKAGSSSDSWRHVPGSDNPADLLSRGLSCQQLRDAHHWWNGPLWLPQIETAWPVTKAIKLSPCEVVADGKETRPKFVGHVREIPQLDMAVNGVSISKRVSDIIRLSRITAFAHRFITNALKAARQKIAIRQGKTSSYVKNLALKTTTDVSGLTCQERQKAITFWIKQTQRDTFRSEWKALSSQRIVCEESKLKKLCPFIDKDDV